MASHPSGKHLGDDEWEPIHDKATWKRRARGGRAEGDGSEKLALRGEE